MQAPSEAEQGSASLPGGFLHSLCPIAAHARNHALTLLDETSVLLRQLSVLGCHLWTCKQCIFTCIDPDRPERFM